MQKFSYFIAIIGAVVGFSLAGGCFATGGLQDFEGYALNTDLQYETDWTTDQTVPNYYYVVENPAGGGKSLEVNFAGSRNDTQAFYEMGTPVADGLMSFDFRATTEADTDQLFVGFLGTHWTARLKFHGGNAFYDIAGAMTQFATYSQNTWYTVQMEYHTSSHSIRYKFGAAAWTEWIATKDETSDAPHIFYINYLSWLAQNPFFIDNIYLPPPGATITITSPATGATITDLTTNLVGTYSGFLNYHDITLGFNEATGLVAAKTYRIYPVDISGAGSFSIPLSYFEFIYNQNYIAVATSWLTAPQLSDMFITQDFISPTGYNLTLNVDTLAAPPFQFTDFPTWYATNAAGGYETPSDFATAIVGFINPIFENAGNFASIGFSYFSQTNSYDKGQEIGLVFPTTQAYLDKINLFFGGFPLMQFLEFLIITMLGIFTIRTIFKFIPFFG